MRLSSTAQAVKLILITTMLSAVSYVQAADSITVAFTGDILLDRGVRQIINHNSPDVLFSPSIDSLFAHTDIVVGNLECPATDIKEPCYKRFIFRSEPEWLHTLKKHHITHLNLANNHSVDQGRRGLMSTIQNVRKAEMIPFGAGTNMSEAAEPVLIAKEPREVYLVASLRLPLEALPYLPDEPSVSQESFNDMIARVANLRAKNPEACIIVTLHWGVEHTTTPTSQQRLEAHRIIDAGADAIIGHHTHTMQTIEKYHGKPIYYSIGNFIFDQQQPLNTRACLPLLTVTQKNMAWDTIPIEIDKCVPHITKQ